MENNIKGWFKPDDFNSLNLMKDRISFINLSSGESEDIQLKMFLLGASWISGAKEPLHLDRKGFQLKNGVLCYGIMKAALLTYEEFLIRYHLLNL